MQLQQLVAELDLLERLTTGVPWVKSIDEEVEELEKMYVELVQNKKLIAKET